MLRVAPQVCVSEGLRLFHEHVRDGFMFPRSAPVLLRLLLESPDQSVVPISDTLSMFMFLAVHDHELESSTVSLMLRRLHAQGRIDDMWTLFSSLSTTEHMKTLTPVVLNQLIVALLKNNRCVCVGGCTGVKGERLCARVWRCVCVHGDTVDVFGVPALAAVPCNLPCAHVSVGLCCFSSGWMMLLPC